MLLLQQMLVLFILMVIGYFLRKKEIMSGETARFLSWLVVHVANPALILSGSIDREKPISAADMGLCLAIAVAMFAVLMLVAAVIPPLFRVEKKSAGTYRVMTVFSNIGFMGFPVIRAVFGSDALLYASMFLIPYNILLYTWGIAQMRGSSGERQKISWKKILNVGVISSLLALALAFSGLKLPDFATSTISYLSGLTAPLSMMVIGASMAGMDFKRLFGDWKLLLFSLLRQIALPLAGMFLLGLFVKDEMLLGVCLIMLSTPVGSMTAMLAQQYGGDYELNSRGVALTTLLSVATIPLVMFLTGL